MTTKRWQVEAVLMARGLVEEASGDWRGAGTYVRLDIRHAPETAWVNATHPDGTTMAAPKEVISYDEVLKRFE
jgi:hypothetical protein